MTAHVELEGLEAFPIGGFLENTTVSPRGPIVESLVKTTVESGSKGGKFTGEQLQNFSRGSQTEAEQLAKRGLQKNNQRIEAESPEPQARTGMRRILPTPQRPKKNEAIRPQRERQKDI